MSVTLTYISLSSDIALYLEDYVIFSDNKSVYPAFDLTVAYISWSNDFALFDC